MRPMRHIPLLLLTTAYALGAVAPGAAPEPHCLVDIGVEGDERAIVEGIYQREGVNSRSRDPFYRSCTFRWFANTWVLDLPVVPDAANLVTFRVKTGRMMDLDLDGQRRTFAFPASPPSYQTRFLIPKAVVGRRDSVRIRGSAVPPYRPSPGTKDGRELAMAVDWIRVERVGEMEQETMAAYGLPAGKEGDLPLPFRLRGTEARPLITDIDSYVLHARLMRCNAMTIGPMNGWHFTAFETRHGTPTPGMQPDFIPGQIQALHEHGIAAIGWLPFNVQDLRKADQCEAANRHPEWRMQYLDWDERTADGRVAMCVVSSPWRDMHADILKEAAGLGLDGVFFDGFYLGGIPHPIAPGCVCGSCREAFEADTGLRAPPRVDWLDMRFRRWVRWRNHKLIETAILFRDRMREASPGLPVTCNYNVWPFGSKDWDTAIPLWATDEYGTSQHAYTGRVDLEWVMMGFKARLSHDLSPRHSDIWRTSKPAWRYDDSPQDRARHELTMRTFMLTGLSYGTTPWHGGHITPHELGVRVHEAVRRREAYFSQDEVRHIGVVLSQNTHDFYGHVPGTTNLADYRDGILAAWLLLTEHHLPFRFVFDNQLEDGDLGEYKVLLLPNMACVSAAVARRLREFAAAGGTIVATGESGRFDEWGVAREADTLDGIPGIKRMPGTPELDWLRQRNQTAARNLLDAVKDEPPPVDIQAPASLAANPCWSPNRHAVWLHLLNVSAFYPLDDTGFRGIGGKPVYAENVASDAQIMLGGKVKRINTPASDIRVRTPGLEVRSARLAVAGVTVTPDDAGFLVLPHVDVHDVLVLELARTANRSGGR